MPDYTPSFTGCLVGAVFATILIPAATSFGMLIVHLAAFACFVVPLVFMIRERSAANAATEGESRVDQVEF